MPYSDIQSGTLGHAVSDSKLLSENRRAVYGERTITRRSAPDEFKVQHVSERYWGHNSKLSV